MRKVFSFLILLCLIVKQSYAFDDIWEGDEVTERTYSVLLDNHDEIISKGLEQLTPVNVIKNNSCHMVFVENHRSNAIYLKHSLVNYNNVKNTSIAKDSYKLEAGDIKQIAQICPEKPSKPSNYSLQISHKSVDNHARGEQGAKGFSSIHQPSNYNYWPPFQKGQRHLISQSWLINQQLDWIKSGGYKKITTHRTKESAYAVDIVMPVGTKICAAREGILKDSIEGYSNNFLYKLLGKANYAYIEHDDGTLALYAHLKKHSLTIKAGQRVKKGECFAESGNTGKSSGPHLHFAILLPQHNDQNFISIPFKFSHNNGHTFPVYLEWINR